MSRTIGDIEAKYEKYGGRQNVVVCTPDINEHKVSRDDDFILMGSDGIFDNLSNEDIVSTVFDIVQHYEKAGGLQMEDVEKGVDLILDDIVQNIMKKSIVQRSEDNVTIILICFSSFLSYIKRVIRTH